MAKNKLKSKSGVAIETETAKAEPTLELDTKVQPKSRPKLRRFFLVTFGTLLVLLLAFVVYAFAFSHKVLPHTQIAGVAVGGLSKAQALTAIETKEKTYLKQDLTLSYKDKTWKIKPESLALKFSNQTALDTAYNFGKSGNLQNQLKELLRAIFLPRYLDVDLSAVDENGKAILSKLALSSIEVVTAETKLDFVPDAVKIIPGSSGQKLDYDNLNDQFYAAFKVGSKSPNLTLSLQPFAPEVTSAMAESERVFAQNLLSGDWQISIKDPTGQTPTVNVTLAARDLAPWLSSTVARISANGPASGLQTVINDDSLKAYISDLADKNFRKPVNAQIKGENGGITVQADGSSGMRVNLDQSITLVKEGLLNHAAGKNKVLELATEVVAPDLTKDSLANLGIKELIGTATTDFNGSPTNRKFNISKGQQVLNGGLVKDGATYSTTGTLGPVDESTGYLPELVIVNNRTKPEAGGGLCQVSTTLFRAVLNAGLPIVERVNHAYRVGYYERGVGPGLDATVYIPEPDFKWKNDTGHAIYIQSYIVGTKITFELYGTKDGRVSTIGAPQILQTIPVGDPIIVQTDTMFKDEKKQLETAHDGARTSVLYTVVRDGKEIYKQTFNSYYQPWPAQFLVGTKDRPAGEVTATPTPTPEATPAPTPIPTPTATPIP